MKLELNIGLSSKTLGELNPVAIVNALTGRGFHTLKFKVVESTCEDGKELCLAVQTLAPNDWQDQITDLAKSLGQDCIACALFLGSDPYEEFDERLWKTPHERENITVDGFTLAEFKNYLKNTIIPDSENSGFEGYARDLTTALLFLNYLSE